jgi:hypothetical protein
MLNVMVAYQLKEHKPQLNITTAELNAIALIFLPIWVYLVF